MRSRRHHATPGRLVIDSLGDDVRAWIAELLGTEQAEVFDRPCGEDEGPAVVMWLFAMRPGPTVRERERDAYRATCRFLITAVADQARRSHDLVGRLLTAALQHPTFEVEPEEPPAYLWPSAGLAPRPAFVLRAEAVAHVERTAAPRVRSPLEVRHEALISMHGRVLGPGETPIPGASIELVEAGLLTRTDRDGRFTLRSVSQQRAQTLEVRTGRQRFAATTEGIQAGEPLTIRLQMKES